MSRAEQSPPTVAVPSRSNATGAVSGMTPAVSVYLDAWRAFAAFGVMLGHVGLPWFSATGAVFPNLGHELVIVFFFLSGFVIADATLGRNRGAIDYAAARLARMYSVVLPALALTALAVLAARTEPELGVAVLRGNESVRLALCAVFLQEAWFLSASPATNAPLWSLGYEFWFYVLFGLWVFVRDARWRWSLLLLVVALVGPKVLLLLPVWLTGVAAWWLQTRFAPSRLIAAGIAGVSGALLLTLWVNGWCFPGGPLAVAPWFYSGRWGSDLLLGALFGAHVLGCGWFWRNTSVPAPIERPVRAAAGLTFSLYAYHYPLLVLGVALPFYDPRRPAHVLGLVLGVLAAIALLHHFTEGRRRAWRERFLRWLGPWRRPVVVS